MNRKRLTGALPALALVLMLSACGGESNPEPAALPTPAQTAAAPLLEQQDMTAVSAMIQQLSQRQMQLITDSIEVSTAQADDAGVSVSLVSAMGDGCYNCFSVLVELPDGAKASGCGFRSAGLLFNDPDAPFESTLHDCVAIEDNSPDESKCTLRLTLGTSRWDRADYQLSGETLRTLRLCDIVSESGETLFKGQWDFSFAYTGIIEHRELLDSPVKIAGAEKGTGDWAQLSSVVLSSFSVCCRYELGDDGAQEPSSYGLPYIEMKSGEKSLIACDAARTLEDCEIREYYFLVPVDVSEVKSLHLSDKITISLD